MKEYKIAGKTYRLDVFNKIRNHSDAYLIGYILGDGAYHDMTHKRNARIGVSSTDMYIIDHFSKTYCPDNACTERQPNSNKKRGIIGKRPYKNLTFSSMFSETFKKHGVLSLKRDRNYHNIPKKLFGSFLLGLFDADGSMSFGRRKDRNRLWANFNITHESMAVLKKIQNDLLLKYSIPTALTEKKGEGCYVLRTAKRQDVEKLYYIMYDNEMSVYNKTKHALYEEYLDSYYAL